MAHQAGSHASVQDHIAHLMNRISVLQQQQHTLRGNVDHLTTTCITLRNDMDGMKQGNRSVAPKTLNGTNGTTTAASNAAPTGAPTLTVAPASAAVAAHLPPHLRARANLQQGNANSVLPPHLGGQKKLKENGHDYAPPQHLKRTSNADGTHPLSPNGNKGALLTTGCIHSSSQTTREPSPTSTIQAEEPRPSIEDPDRTRSSQGWMPLAVQRCPPLSPSIAANIPSTTQMTTFSADFLRNQLGGTIWSPGLNYVAPPTLCILPHRSYYTLDGTYEPYLPKAPGTHGAKLTAFFNDNAEDSHPGDRGNSYENVPVFVCASPWSSDSNQHRYVYFGNYTQVRWSDKLDYDRMVDVVPPVVKQYWADELAAVGRPQWVTTELMKHFWPMPEYEGRLFQAQNVDDEVDDEEHEERVKRDIAKYVRLLRDWEKDARLKTSMIKKEFILQAFERPDADEPRGLRLWWEYLQCVDWDQKFYEMLVQLQSRNKNYL